MTLKFQLNEMSERAQAFSVENLIGGRKEVPLRYPEVRSYLTRRKNSTGSRRNLKTAKNGSDLSMELCSSELWDRFNEIGTEMIITKAGRRMFPTLKVRFHGLLSSATYIVYMDIVPVGNTRYRYIYHSSQWMSAGPGDSFPVHNLYIHPDSPATGQLWMSQGHISFDKVKLTNNKKPVVRGQISLHSMHKYQPRVHILEVLDPDCLTVSCQADMVRYIQSNTERTASFSFQQTQFITVTAYQNQEITRLKIQSNPFAKGFRDTTRPREDDKLCKEETFQPFLPLASSRTAVFNTEVFHSLQALDCGLWGYGGPKIPVKILIPPESWGSNNRETKTVSHTTSI